MFYMRGRAVELDERGTERVRLEYSSLSCICYKELHYGHHVPARTNVHCTMSMKLQLHVSKLLIFA